MKDLPNLCLSILPIVCSCLFGGNEAAKLRNVTVMTRQFQKVEKMLVWYNGDKNSFFMPTIFMLNFFCSIFSPGREQQVRRPIWLRPRVPTLISRQCISLSEAEQWTTHHRLFLYVCRLLPFFTKAACSWWVKCTQILKIPYFEAKAELYEVRKVENKFNFIKMLNKWRFYF